MYKSPLHILSGLETEASEFSNSDFLLRLRKKLLAEFNLSNQPTIDINGKAYSKDEVIKTIDVLMGDSNIALHTFIYSNKKLLDFLENDASPIIPFEIKQIVVPEEIKPKLSPILFERIAFNLKKAFQKRNFNNARNLIIDSPDLQETEKGKLEEEISKNILNIKDHIRSVRVNGCKNIVRELDYLREDALALLLNKLPDEFIYTVNALVGEIINVMVEYDKIKGCDRSFLYRLSTDLCKIKCDDALMQLIKKNHAVFKQGYESNSGQGESGFGALKAVGLIISLVLLMARLFSGNSSHSNSDFLSNSDTFIASGYEEFKNYREHVLSIFDTSKYNSFNSLTSLEMNPIVSYAGNTPFSKILQRNSKRDYLDSNLTPVIIKNASEHDLIIFAFDDSDARAYYFYNNDPDTFCFKKNDKLCFYFGNKFSVKFEVSGYADVSIRDRVQAEPFFDEVDEKGREIFAKNFTIQIKQPKSSNKSPKKIETPEIILDKKFLENGSYKKGGLKIFPIASDTSNRISSLSK